MEHDELLERMRLQELAYRYARIVDDRDYDLVREVFVEDGVLEAPFFEPNRVVGHEALIQAMHRIEEYDAVMHAVHNQRVEIRGDEASGDVYCVAHHILEHDDRPSKFELGVRYGDSYRRTSAGWRIAHRLVRVLWGVTIPLGGYQP